VKPVSVTAKVSPPGAPTSAGAASVAPEAFRARVRDFVAREVLPYRARWAAAGGAGREVWLAAGRAGLLGIALPVSCGGLGVDDPCLDAVLARELAAAGAAPDLPLHNAVAARYLRDRTTPGQRQRWLRALCAGTVVAAAAVGEPLPAAMPGPRGDGWVLHGRAASVGNGRIADVVVVAARTGPPVDRPGAAGDTALLVVERGMPGLTRERVRRDTADLLLTGVHVPRVNLLAPPDPPPA
jgi:alkylation response protein AidB-like acyl-CoA dehydrogenase